MSRVLPIADTLSVLMSHIERGRIRRDAVRFVIDCNRPGRVVEAFVGDACVMTEVPIDLFCMEAATLLGFRWEMAL
jgi:hypothetical protein